MQTFIRTFGSLALLLALLVATASSVSAAHNGNNKADLVGTGDPDATGQAVLNYSEGRSTFNGRSTVQNLESGETYTFKVTGAAAGADGVEICTAEANKQGTFSCNEQNLPLPGFTTATIEDEDGNEVASGVFDRRGNCRDADQAGSQCEALDAPGRNRS